MKHPSVSINPYGCLIEQVIVLTSLVLFATTVAAAADSTDLPKPNSRTVRTIEGWTVRVDDRLLAPPDDAVGRRALQMLESKLVDIYELMRSVWEP